MRHSWKQRINKGTAAATLSRFLFISALLTVGGLAMVASVSSGGPGSKSIFERTAAKVATERGSGRVRANRGAEIACGDAAGDSTDWDNTVDRTTIRQALRSARAPNDCSLAERSLSQI